MSDVERTHLTDKNIKEFGTSLAIEQFFEQHRLPISLTLGGLLLVAFGLLAWRSGGQRQSQIKILPARSNSFVNQTIQSLAIDVSGAVENPGLYHLELGSRVEDALIAAGGLSPNAHRDWVAQHLNRARKLTDGEKLFIPHQNENPADLSLKPEAVAGAALVTTSINTATQQQLESLWGVGPVTAQAIIDGRPYSTLNELLNRKIINQNVWEKNKDKLSL